MLNLITAINEMWARAHKPQLKSTVLQIMLSTVAMKTQVSAKSSPMKLMLILVHDVPHVLMCRHPVPQVQTVNSNMYM
jgi:hypothetical protein